MKFILFTAIIVLALCADVNACGGRIKARRAARRSGERPVASATVNVLTAPVRIITPIHAMQGGCVGGVCR